MITDEQRAYLEQTYRKAPEGSARRIWAAAQLAKLSPTAPPCHPERSTAVRSRRISSSHQEQNS
jgi:hypothetical protein